MAMIMAFIMAVLTVLRSLTSSVTKKLPESSSKLSCSFSPFILDNIPKVESRPPSPTPEFPEAELLSSVTRRLGELEVKVDTLQTKRVEMPYEKEELLDAAVRRVDALEAELIATKKVSFLRFLFHSL